VGVADAVLSRGFAGLYVDANAVSPRTARSIGARVTAAGARFVDGGIVGPPLRGGRATVLYLSGEAAGEVTALFQGCALDTLVVGTGVGQASALKMAFAGWSKGSAALLLGAVALARAEGVGEGLQHAWQTLSPELPARAAAAASRNASKAWRFAGEMREIAATFEAAGLPGGFHTAAGELYQRLAGFKDADSAELDAVIARLIEPHHGRDSH
jgi:3-hydroxyisobutyrate dehydrogenase-like beta-hydroxyacid dehydrogenase